jgi:hypothetical protein
MFVGIALIVGASGAARAAEPDRKAVEQALGKSGQMQAGDVFRVGMPRTDPAVSVKGLAVKAGFALGSYAAFKQVGDTTMVMGDLVLLDLRQQGIDVTALHNHGLMDTPRLFYMHFWATDDAVKLARGLRAALDQTNSQSK